MRVVFMGTPDFAVPTLAEIAGHGHEIAAVFTRAPARAGRGMALVPSPVQALAERLGLSVETPRTLRDAAVQERLAALAPEVIVVVAYGMILPRAVLEIPPAGCLNLHASLLPRWRGAAPIHRAVMAGDRETGVMVMRMEEGLDTGPVAMAERVAIGSDETTGELHDRLKVIGADLMARALAALSRNALGFSPQAETGITYAAKITNEEARIDFSLPATAVHDHIRGLSPAPGAYAMTDFGRGPERLRVLRACRADGSGAPGTCLDDRLTIACGKGAVRLLTVQRAGGRAVPTEEFLRGTPLPTGSRIG
jgi:methionyl-tRNA formyltransferase